MNIKSRKSAYATALIIVFELDSFHAIFAIELERSNQKKLRISKLYRDDLSMKSRYWKQILRHRFFQKFQITVHKEFFELKKRSTLTWIEKTNQFRISLTWVFKYKFDTDDYLKKFKTRFCVRENLQSIKQNSYAATLAAKTFRALMIISIAFDLDIWHYDVVSVFVNNEIDEKIFNECSKEFARFESCWKLNKTLYDLKQVSILWYRNLTVILKDLDLQSIFEINCLFANDWLIVFFYVNDIVRISMKENANRMRSFEKALMKRFEMRILKELKWFLEIRITRDRKNRKIWLCQNLYINKMMIKFHFEKMKCSKTSLSNLSRINQNKEMNQKKSDSQRVYAFQQKIKFLNFVVVISRLDIVFATAKLAQFLKNSNSNHFIAVNRVISYLNETKNLTIEYSSRIANILLCVSDATFADDEMTRKSSDDYFFKLYESSIDWRIAKQATITTFSIEATLLILSRIAKKIIWWKRFFELIRFDIMKKLHILCDNRHILKILNKKMLKLDTKLKHIDIHQHWLRQKVQIERINVSWISIAKMFVKKFTKILSRQKHEKFLKQLHLIDISHLIIENDTA
jgi:hypothetical protein